MGIRFLYQKPIEQWSLIGFQFPIFTLNLRLQVYHMQLKRTWLQCATFANACLDAPPTWCPLASLAYSTRWTSLASPSASTALSTVSTHTSTHSCATRSRNLCGLVFRYVNNLLFTSQFIWGRRRIFFFHTSLITHTHSNHPLLAISCSPSIISSVFLYSQIHLYIDT